MSSHVAPLRLYLAVFAALLALTFVTVWVAGEDWGRFNLLVALGIASTKALLVMLYFMHLRWSSKLTWVFAASGFLFLMILLSLTLSDYLTRVWLPVYV